MRSTIAAVLLAVTPLFACDNDPAGEDGSQIFDFDLATGPLGWSAGFTDYPAGEEEKHELTAEHTQLPPPLDQGRRGFLLSGNNQSDDLFMFLKRRVSGLEPATEYAIRFRVEFATNAPTGCAGVGGAPGESVVIKAGATAEEPQAMVDGGGDVRLSVDKGDQLEAGSATLVLGDVASSDTDCLDPSYELKTLDSADEELVATSDDDGRIWLFVGSESGYESTTALYFTRIRAQLRAR